VTEQENSALFEMVQVAESGQLPELWSDRASAQNIHPMFGREIGGDICKDRVMRQGHPSGGAAAMHRRRGDICPFTAGEPICRLSRFTACSPEV